jgi:hypothetical protein
MSNTKNENLKMKRLYWILLVFLILQIVFYRFFTQLFS